MTDDDIRRSGRLDRGGRPRRRVRDDAAAGLLRTRGRRRPAAGARGRVHRHPASAVRRADVPLGSGQAGRDLHRLRPQHGGRRRRALADQPLVPDAERRRVCAAAAGRSGHGVRISDPARAVRGVAHRICRRSQSLRRRRRHRRDGLVLFGLDDGPAGRLFRRGGRRHHAARSAPRPGDQGGDARPDGRNPGRDLPRPRRGASGHARADRARRRRPDQDGALVQRPA